MELSDQNRGREEEEEVIGIPVSSSFRSEKSSHPKFINPSLRRKDSMVDRLNKLCNKTDSFVHGVREHVSVGLAISETVMGKLSLGKKLINNGGFEGVFRKSFTVGEEEKMVKASQCYLFTTGGPVAGLLFTSTERIGFCSERKVKTGSTPKLPYKVLIPLKKIKGVFPSENIDNPNQKYLHIVTNDGFEFWFMGFVNYKKALKSAQKALLSER